MRLRRSSGCWPGRRAHPCPWPSRRRGGGEGAAGAVVVPRVEPWTAEVIDRSVVPHDVDRLVGRVGDRVAALDHDRGSAERAQGASRLTLLGERADRGVEQDLGLAHVGGDHCRLGQEGLQVQALRLGLEQAVAAGGDHHRVDDEPGQPAGRREVGDGVDDVGRREHARFHRSDGEVVEHGVDLRDDEIGGHRMYTADPSGVLGGQRGDGGGAEDAERGEGLQVGLDAGAAAGVRAGNGQRDGWGHAAVSSSAAR
jgi:hypothetical protein